MRTEVVCATIVKKPIVRMPSIGGMMVAPQIKMEKKG